MAQCHYQPYTMPLWHSWCCAWSSFSGGNSDKSEIYSSLNYLWFLDVLTLHQLYVSLRLGLKQPLQSGLTFRQKICGVGRWWGWGLYEVGLELEVETSDDSLAFHYLLSLVGKAGKSANFPNLQLTVLTPASPPVSADWKGGHNLSLQTERELITPKKNEIFPQRTTQ